VTGGGGFTGVDMTDDDQIAMDLVCGFGGHFLFFIFYI
jgi:hypothetical protein